jgi:hypothetical protein
LRRCVGKCGDGKLPPTLDAAAHVKPEHVTSEARPWPSAQSRRFRTQTATSACTPSSVIALTTIAIRRDLASDLADRILPVEPEVIDKRLTEAEVTAAQAASLPGRPRRGDRVGHPACYRAKCQDRTKASKASARLLAKSLLAPW